MKFTFRNAANVAITSGSDLESLIPAQMSGVCLNYGQGEGQLKVGESVWGFYFNDAGDYTCTLEEGVLSLDHSFEIAAGILERGRLLWGADVDGEVLGCHNGDQAV